MTEHEVLKEKVKKGEFVPSGKVDELTKALGTAEHYGRVRGVGGRVGHKQYIGRCKRTRDESTTVISPEFLEKLTKQITEQVRSEVYKDFEKMMGEKQTNGNVSYSVHNEKDAAEVEMNCNSGNVSDHISDPFDAIPEKGFECELTVQDTNDFTKVALGRVFKTTSQASVCHGKKIGA
ncbi:uncharacterized protein LOC141627557 [Silene latifolia]|uniref:uncharacterized protein LOC141627557 n=1 Tax=Silene latifolia TaxID=37657 RepID=UPI003D77C4E3